MWSRKEQPVKNFAATYGPGTTPNNKWGGRIGLYLYKLASKWGQGQLQLIKQHQWKFNTLKACDLLTVYIEGIKKIGLLPVQRKAPSYYNHLGDIYKKKIISWRFKKYYVYIWQIAGTYIPRDLKCEQAEKRKTLPASSTLRSQSRDQRLASCIYSRHLMRCRLQGEEREKRWCKKDSFKESNRRDEGEYESYE